MDGNYSDSVFDDSVPMGDVFNSRQQGCSGMPDLNDSSVMDGAGHREPVALTTEQKRYKNAGKKAALKTLPAGAGAFSLP